MQSNMCIWWLIGLMGTGSFYKFSKLSVHILGGTSPPYRTPFQITLQSLAALWLCELLILSQCTVCTLPSCGAFLSGSREDSVWRTSGPPKRTLRLILETPKLTWSHMLAVAETMPFKRHVVASPGEEDFFSEEWTTDSPCPSPTTLAPKINPCTLSSLLWLRKSIQIMSAC